MSTPPGPPAIPPPGQPPNQPPNQPPSFPPGQPPPDPGTRWSKEKRRGAIVATLVVVLVPLTFLAGGWSQVVFLAPVVAFFSVLLGSVLTVFRRTRQFAVGFLIASAILIVVTSGVCSATLRFTMNSA